MLLAIKIMKLEAPIIPKEMTEFAKAVAALADSHGIDNFRLNLTPTWDQARWNTDQNCQVCGDVSVNYSVTDGRGRPCKNLSVMVDAKLESKILKQAESF